MANEMAREPKNVTIEGHMVIGDFKCDGKICGVRGRESWNYFYLVLGVALSILGAMTPMTPLEFPSNLCAFAALIAVAFWLSK